VAQDLHDRGFQIVESVEPLPEAAADVHVMVLEAHHRLSSTNSAAAVVALIPEATDHELGVLCGDGASAALDVETPPDELADVVRLVACGHRVVPATCRVLAPAAPLQRLSARQLQVLAALHPGRTQEAAANRLGSMSARSRSIFARAASASGSQRPLTCCVGTVKPCWLPPPKCQSS